MLRQSNQHEEYAWAIASLINGCNPYLKHAVSVEDILGRPLRADMDSALAKKDAARRRKVEEHNAQGY